MFSQCKTNCIRRKKALSPGTGIRRGRAVKKILTAKPPYLPLQKNKVFLATLWNLHYLCLGITAHFILKHGKHSAIPPALMPAPAKVGGKQAKRIYISL